MAGFKIIKPLVVDIFNNKLRRAVSDEVLAMSDIPIPTPILKVKPLDLGLLYTPLLLGVSVQEDIRYQDATLEPQFWFFKLRPRGTRRQYDVLNDVNYTRRVTAKWVHPTDVARGGKMEGNELGSTYSYWGESLRPHNTEFNLEPMTVLRGFNYQAISFDPFQFFSYKGNPLNPVDLPLNQVDVKASGISGGYKKKRRTVWGYFCISILDTTPGVGYRRRIFGPPSQVFTIKPYIKNSKIEGLLINLSIGNNKRNLI